LIRWEARTEYYRNVFKVIANELARVDCEIKEVRRPSVFLNQCNFEIKWKLEAPLQIIGSISASPVIQEKSLML